MHSYSDSKAIIVTEVRMVFARLALVGTHRQEEPLAGTFYTEFGDYSHQALQLKNGIYAGGETAWARTITEKNITVTRINASGTKTWTAS